MHSKADYQVFIANCFSVFTFSVSSIFFPFHFHKINSCLRDLFHVDVSLLDYNSK